MLLSGAISLYRIRSSAAWTPWGPARAVMLIVIAQLLVAYVIRLLGAFGVEKQPAGIAEVISMGMAIVKRDYFQMELKSLLL